MGHCLRVVVAYVYSYVCARVYSIYSGGLTTTTTTGLDEKTFVARFGIYSTAPHSSDPLNALRTAKIYTPIMNSNAYHYTCKI